MDAIVDFCQIPFDIPAELLEFLFFEPLEFFNEVELELDRYPGREFKGDVFVGKSAAVAPCLGNNANCTGAFDPLFRGQSKAVQACLFSKPVEFDGFKIQVVEPLPYTQKFNRIAVAQPISDQVIRVLRVSVASDVCKANVVRLINGANANRRVQHTN